MRTCEDLGQATGVENHHDDKQNTSISYLIDNFRSVFLVSARTILEGERDYGEQALATPTLQRLYVLHGVVNVALVRVKVQCEKSKSLLWKSETSFIHSPEAHLRTTDKTHMLYFIVLCGQDRIP